MNAIARRSGLPRFPDLADLFDAPFFSTHGSATLRVETTMEDDRYVVRVETPGMDPDEDLTVTVEHGVLSIQGERSESETSPQHSEFRYGSFSRTLTLPSDASEEDVVASYDKGILEVSIGLAKQEKISRKVPISRKSEE
ncbi:Hsp20/alpha crystallin family protein [Nocardiopsis sp. EMB25]|uniref:Hsp20/alpha crystallin family protein n=1 Tax=Nocardiopsis TaxID=2013 RepID=UPI0003480C7A|nr:MULTISPECIES: Hsp20/alpha crystallin family protein [Nocardiopsis]MCY9783436.1 Hsp20/alpha crystallin family protein [Nocardiopsis sp. EMB25]